MTVRRQNSGSEPRSSEAIENTAIDGGVSEAKATCKPDYRKPYPPLENAVAHALADWLAARSVRDQAIPSPYPALEMGNAFDAFERELGLRDIDRRSKTGIGPSSKPSDDGSSTIVVTSFTVLCFR